MKNKFLKYLLIKIRIPKLLKQNLITFEQAKQFFEEAKIDPVELSKKLDEIEIGKVSEQIEQSATKEQIEQISAEQSKQTFVIESEQTPAIEKQIEQISEEKSKRKRRKKNENE